MSLGVDVTNNENLAFGGIMRDLLVLALLFLPPAALKNPQYFEKSHKIKEEGQRHHDGHDSRRKLQRLDDLHRNPLVYVPYGFFQQAGLV
mmetsp:Transcript_21522/g.44900  ORF Transcript_21522/g.44900 Transcript_21522/m.44900 type:complete len:90 (-) Transcript_21522:425-694(-)